jgi:hypothetical protein
MDINACKSDEAFRKAIIDVLRQLEGLKRLLKALLNG